MTSPRRILPDVEHLKRSNFPHKGGSLVPEPSAKCNLSTSPVVTGLKADLGMDKDQIKHMNSKSSMPFSPSIRKKQWDDPERAHSYGT